MKKKPLKIPMLFQIVDKRREKPWFRKMKNILVVKLVDERFKEMPVVEILTNLTKYYEVSIGDEIEISMIRDQEDPNFWHMAAGE